MKELSISARECLNAYLQKVRARLRWANSLDADEIERDICEHIERDLDSADEPVEYETVAEVLDRLGSPEQWVPDGEISWWRKVLMRISSGPDDWRLAYISFGLFVLAFFQLRIGMFIFIPLSFIVARGALSMTDDLDQLKGRKVLLYPVLILIYAILGLFLLAGPAFGLVGLADGFEREIIKNYDDIKESLDYWWWTWVIILFVLGIWWIILSGISIAFDKFFKFIFKPFLDKVNKKKLALTAIVAGWLLILVAIGLGWIFGASDGPANLFKQFGLM
ncbi:MAG: hypothetical protein FVQ79_05330 [Planctomycetes bacterium]|nr:hypothetical protein [Planctomycetota bacterium]